MNKYIVKSFDEILTIINNIRKTESTLWFRGHSKASYSLTPNALRNVVPIRNSRGQKIEDGKFSLSNGDSITAFDFESAFNKFKQRAPSFISQYIPKNDFEWLFLFQHYGGPTRLLDWSTNPLIALYFSSTSRDNPKYKNDYYECIEEEFEKTKYCENAAVL